MAAKKFHYQTKDIEYLKKQDLLVYQKWYPTVSVLFVDSSNTPIDTFGSQDLIKYHDAVEMDVLIRFDNMEKVMDKYDLEEVPEAIAVFSIAVIEDSDLSAEESNVEADVLILDYAGEDWRVTKAFRQDYLGHNKDEFIHWECILERNIRSNIQTEETVQFSTHFYGVGNTGLTMEDIYRFDSENLIEAQFFFTSASQKLYFVYAKTLGALTDIQDKDGFSDFINWTEREETFESVDYYIYETNNLRTGVAEQFTFFRA